MTTAFARLPPSMRAGVLLVAAAGTIGLSIALSRQGQPLRDRVPGGILAYEFAWSAARAQEIRTAWQDVLPVARRQLLLDFPFLILYPIALALACALLADAKANTLAPVGAFLSFAVLLAAPLDATENLALLRMLAHSPTTGLARLAGLCAGVKFTLVFSALGYLLLQGSAVAISAVRAKFAG